MKVEKAYQGLFSMARCAKGKGNIRPQETSITPARLSTIFLSIKGQLVAIMTGSTDNGSSIRNMLLVGKEKNAIGLPRILVREGRTQKCRRV